MTDDFEAMEDEDFDFEDEEEGIKLYTMNGVIHLREIDQDGN